MRLLLKIAMELLRNLIVTLLVFGPYCFLILAFWVLFELFSFKSLIALVALLCLIWAIDINKIGGKYFKFCDKIFDKIDEKIQNLEK